MSLVQRQLTRGTLTAAALQAAALITAFALQLSYTHLLSPVEFGVYAQVVQAIMLGTAVLVMGIRATHLQLVPAYIVHEESALLRGWLRYSTSRSLAMSMVVSAVVLVGLSVLGGSWAWRWGAMILVPSVALFLLQGLGLGLKQVALGRAPIDLVRPLLAFAIFLVLTRSSNTTADHAVLALLLANGLALMVAALWLVRVAPKSLFIGEHKLERADWRRRMSQFFGQGVFAMVLDRADILVVGWFHGPKAAGVYTIVVGLGKLLLFALASVNTIAAPLVSELHNRGDRAGVQLVLRRGVLAAVVLATVTAVALASLGSIVLGFFGETYVVGLHALWIGLAGSLLNAACGSCALVVSMTGHQRITWRVMGGAAAMMLALDLIIVPTYGLEGAAAVRSLTMASWNATLAVYASRRLGYQPSILSWIPSKERSWPDDAS